MNVMIIAQRMNNLHPYIPGEQPKDREYIKLNANENPYPPSTDVIDKAIESLRNKSKMMTLYPDPDSNELHKAIAEMLNQTGGVLCRCVSDGEKIQPSKEDKIPFTVTPEMIYSGNGSDEVLSFVFYAFFDSSKKFIMPEFTYSFYPVYAGFYNIPSELVKLNDDWSLNKEKIIELANKNDSGVIFANPNAPTGIGLKREEIRQMLMKTKKDEIFIVDEAYVDFGGESCIPLLEEFDNLLIVRTFSKSLCCAGMRLGYIVASPKLIEIVTTVKNSVNHFPIDALAQVCGKATCENVGYYIECAKKIAKERDSFYDFLIEKGFSVNKSETNFLFAKKEGISGEDLYKRVKAEGILIRHFATKGIEDYVRITVGNHEQMELLKKAILKIIEKA